MDEPTPKYSLNEIERRWLVSLDRVGALSELPSRRIDDLYIVGGRLRLRRVEDRDGGVVCKLTKKYGKRNARSEPITTLYLTADEYAAFASLRGVSASKVRYTVAAGSLDVCSSPHPGLAIFEKEFETEDAARTYDPPGFVTDEVTDDDRYSGAAIAGAAPASIEARSASPG
jgi:CYTH domain-containing protein